LNKVEPSVSVLARNLLAKDHARMSLGDESSEGGPKMSMVVEPFATAGRRERLAGTTPCPDFLAVRPSGEAQGVAPDPDAGEEVALGESGKVGWSNIDN
jgi:hypothetical protein